MVDRGEQIVVIRLLLGGGGAHRMARVHRIELHDVDVGGDGMPRELEHRRSRSRLRWIGVHGNAPTALIDADLVDAAQLGGRERVTFAGAAASQVDADVRRDHVPQDARAAPLRRCRRSR